MQKKTLKVLAAALLLAGVGAGLASCGNNNTGNESVVSQESAKPSVTVTANEITVAEGETAMISATTTGGTASYVSVDESIATVDANGKVTGVAEGTTKVRVIVGEGANSAVAEVTVTVTSKDANIAGKVVVDESIPSEIVVNGELNLDDYVTVTRVSKWSITTESSTISIDGHTIKGVDYGAFTATIVAGTTKRAVNGYVVSKNKQAFNAFLGTIKNNYSSSSSVSESYWVTDKYYAALSHYDSSTGTISFEGAIKHPTSGKYYAYTTTATQDSTTYAINWASSLTMAPGYGKTPANEGVGSFSANTNDFVELLGDDGTPVTETENGVTYYEYELLETGSSDASSIAAVMASVGQDYWTWLVNNYKAARMFVIYSPSDGAVIFQPADSSGNLISITSNGKSRSTSFTIGEVGSVSIPSAEAWLQSPVIPDAIDVSPLQTFFDNMQTQKNFTIVSKGGWVDPSNNNASTSCPTNMKFQDGTELFSSYEEETHVSANIIEDNVKSISSTSLYVDAKNGPGMSVGVTAETISGTTYASYKGTYTAATSAAPESYSYSSTAASTGTASITDFSSTVYGGAALKTNGLSNGTVSLLDITSFYALDNTTTAGTSVYSWNDNGEDVNYSWGTSGSTYGIGLRGLLSLMGSQAAYLNAIYIDYEHWGQFVDQSLTLTSDKATAKFDFDFNSSAHYVWTVEFSGVGTNAVSSAAQALISGSSTTIAA